MSKSLSILGSLLLAVNIAGCTSPPPELVSAPSPSSAEPPRRFGELMSEVGRRFERAGRAGRAESWELADYDLHELEEAFEDDVPTARVPSDVPFDVLPIAAAFADGPLVELRRAARAHDASAFSSAFAAAASACNACHQAAAHGFIVVPMRPGDAVPVIGLLEAPPSEAPPGALE